MQLADRVLQLKPSATLAVNALALELKAAGREIISLSLGEPDFDTPRAIKDAAIQAIESGFTKYTAESGINELRSAAAAYFNKNYGANAGAEHILIANGGKQCLFNLILATINPGDEVIIPTPYWVTYPAIVEIAGGVPVFAPAGADKGFKVTVEDLERCFTPKTRMCIINSPSNPSGVLYTESEVAALAKWAVDKGILLLADEIYDQLVYGDMQHSSFCQWWQKHPQNFAIVNGVAKSFAMTGWRVGYLLADSALIKEAGKLQGQSTSNVCSIAQKAALAALTGYLPEMDEMKKAFERRCKLVVDIIAGWKDVVCPTPQGAFYVFPDVHRLYTDKIKNSSDMCSYLLEEAGVAMVPGVAFGDDNCIRISYATDDATIEKALHKVAKALYK
ncbi:pyridoxal phosphate-dependent aminotransferase [Desulfovibrio sp. OttesenSCG-928-F07]|nr:pyridoxal phosphate-dependent aminotransferase [Desulfovibrio sp. OttesenSCG-928-F07]